MRTIYMQAVRVVISVGALTQWPPIAITLLHQIYEKLGDNEQVASILNNPENNQKLRGVLEILDKPYWSRVWIIQEIYSASSLVLYCGDESIEWTDLRDIHVALDASHYNLMGEISRKDPNLKRLRVAICQRGAAEFKIDPKGSAQPLDLPQVMLNHRQKKASDGRDMVYSLVGLTKSREDSTFILDYSRTISQVYCDLIENALVSSQRLDLICDIPRSPSHNEMFPSYVPEWRYSGESAPYSMLDNRPEYQYNADSGLAAVATISGRVLIARGFVIEEAGTLGRESTMKNVDDHIQGIQDLHSWRSLLYSMKEQSLESDHAFCRTMLCDKIIQRHTDEIKSTHLGLIEYTLGAIAKTTRELCPEIELDDAMKGYEENTSKDMTPAWSWSWAHSPLRRSYRRRFFITKSRIIGLAPVTVREGDKICILLGCKVPVILREEDDHWIYIGEAYVDKHMYGKGVEEMRSGKFVEKDFEIH